MSATPRYLTLGFVAAALMGLGCSPHAPDRRTELPADGEAGAAPVVRDTQLWYQQSRTIDLTGDGRPDTARLEAVGANPDSLRITLVLIAAGAVRHEESWGSSYELALADSALPGGAHRAALLRARLDSVLSSVAVQDLDAPGVRIMTEDSVILAGLEPQPTQRVSFAYGYETAVRLVWDARRGQFVRLWSCC